MTHFISIQNTYDFLELALFTDDTCIKTVQEDKKNASKRAIPLLGSLLQDHKLTLTDLSFIGVNYGPGPFTTLRVIIATVNGLSFATKLPLIGIDGLQALLAQSADANYPETIALLNAFNKDVYFGIQLAHWTGQTRGYANIETFLKTLSDYQPSNTLRFIGNASSLYKDEITAALSEKQIIIDDGYPTCSVEQVGHLAYEQWQQKTDLSYKLSAHYLKTQQYKNQYGVLTTLK